MVRGSAVERVFVTGGSGFIGTNLVEALTDAGHTVQNFDVRQPQKSAHANRWAAGDVRDRTGLGAAIQAFQPTWLVHLAARTDLRGQTVADYESNTLGVANTLGEIDRCRSIRRVLFASTRMVMTIGKIPEDPRDYQPPNAYGRSKVIGEQLVREADIRASWTIIRPTSIWGPWFGVPYRNFFEAVLSGRYVHPMGIRVEKSFGYVGNAAYQMQRLLEAADELVTGRTFYVADYEPIEVYEWGNAIARLAGCRAPRKAPLNLLRLAAYGGSWLEDHGILEVAPLTRFRLSNLITPMVFNMGALEKVVGPCPYTLEEGIARTLAFLEEEKAQGELERAQ